MKKVLLQSIIVLLGLYSTQLTAQKMPRRVYNATAYNEPATNPNSPRYTSSLIMEYTDGTTSYANISEIKRTIPGARRELRLGAAAVWGQAGLVFPAAACWSAMVIAIGKTGDLVQIGAGAVGLVGSFWLMGRLNKSKRKHLGKFIDVCNDYYADQINKKARTGFILNTVTPDKIELGALNNNSIGINFTWSLSGK